MTVPGTGRWDAADLFPLILCGFFRCDSGTLLLRRQNVEEKHAENLHKNMHQNLRIVHQKFADKSAHKKCANISAPKSAHQSQRKISAKNQCEDSVSLWKMKNTKKSQICAKSVQNTATRNHERKNKVFSLRGTPRVLRKERKFKRFGPLDGKSGRPKNAKINHNRPNSPFSAL